MERATTSSQVFYAGDFWNAIATTTAGQSPDTHASKWEVVGIPADWRRELVTFAQAFLLEAQGQQDKSQAALAMGNAYLGELRETEAAKLGRRPQRRVRVP